jgi:hypothetical protein
MHPNTAPDNGATSNHETWMSGLATLASFVFVIVLAALIANEGVAYLDAKLDQLTNGPAWLKKW